MTLGNNKFVLTSMSNSSVLNSIELDNKRNKEGNILKEWYIFQFIEFIFGPGSWQHPKTGSAADSETWDSVGGTSCETQYINLRHAENIDIS